ncbi:MFS transporter [Rhodococcus maanshanensis]|uniref:Predicted arabinose efflux permease, MFS family n=1 Tax=Rhodococcus maanshanensis TaxID=183556 RepID=A0A1H7X600_9NOCA|nr:MFS transporter [Rhodococcus maanshanensis]SEM28568.1 Predicted arabinose efflux permease, MFS family [Rhodococcus maanshanensis]
MTMTTTLAGRDVPHRRGSPGYTRTTLALFAAGLTTFISMYSTQALLPALAADFAVPPGTAALAVSVTTGVLALAVIPASVLSERFGRTRVMIWSAVLSCAVGLVLPLSPTIEWLLVGRVVQGVALAGIPAVAMAYLAEEVHGTDLGAAMGRYVAGTTIGGLLGRLIPSSVLDMSTWRWAMEASAVAALLLAVVMAMTMPESRFFRPKPVSWGTVTANLVLHLRNPDLRVLFALGFILMGGFVSAYNFLGFRLLAPPFDLTEAAVGAVFLLYLAGTVTAAVAGRLSDLVGRRWVLLAAVCASAVGLVVTLPDHLALVLIGMLLFTGGFFAAHSVASGWVGALATEHRAEASSLYLCAYYLGSSLAAAGAGLAFGWGGWTATVAYVGALLLAAIWLSVVMLRRVEVRRADASA